MEFRTEHVCHKSPRRSSLVLIHQHTYGRLYNAPVHLNATTSREDSSMPRANRYFRFVRAYGELPRRCYVAQYTGESKPRRRFVVQWNALYIYISHLFASGAYIILYTRHRVWLLRLLLRVLHLCGVWKIDALFFLELVTE